MVGRGAVVNSNSMSDWFAPWTGSEFSALRLFCLPFAGGGAIAYRDWRNSLPRTVSLDVVALPGRENRLAEPPEFQVADIASALVERIDRPYAVYGHSMGGRLAFEVVRELRRRNAPPPLRLYVGACRPPHVPEESAAAADLSDDDLIARVASFGGTPAEVFADPDLRALLLPIVRADFTWLRDYEYVPEPALDSPVVAFAGLDDATMPPESMTGWARHTRAGFRLHTVRGGHFFLSESPAPLTALIAADLLDAGFRTGLPRPLALPESDEVHVFAVRSAAGDSALTRVFDAYDASSVASPGELRVAAATGSGVTVVAASRAQPVEVAVGGELGAPSGRVVHLELPGAEAALRLPASGMRLRVQTMN